VIPQPEPSVDRRPLLIVLVGLALYGAVLLELTGPAFHQPLSRSDIEASLIWLTGDEIQAGFYEVPVGLDVQSLYENLGLSLPPDATDFARNGPALQVASGRTPELAELPAGIYPLLNLPTPLNRADQEALLAISGIGPVLAERILAERAKRGGRFESVDELGKVPGIGPAKLAKLKEELSVKGSF